jgi:hypothetical protein
VSRGYRAGLMLSVRKKPVTQKCEVYKNNSV